MRLPILWVGTALVLIAAGCDQESPHVAPLQEQPDSFAQAQSGPEVQISVRPAIYVPPASETSTTSATQKPDAPKPHHHRHHPVSAPVTTPQPASDDQTKVAGADGSRSQPPWHDQLEKAKQSQDDQGWKHGEDKPNDGSDPGNGNGDSPSQDDGG